MISIGNLKINKLCLGDVAVSKAYLGDVEVYGSKPKPEGKYMTITVLDGASGTTIAPTIKGSLKPKLQYRINNNGNWTNFNVGTTADIHLVAGDWVQFKGNNTSGLSTSLSDYIKFNISGNNVHLSGNVMSLIDGVGDVLVIPNEYCFNYLFSGSSVKSVTSDFLPATTLKKSCYYNMFNGCKSLVNAPALPATSLETHCYYGMFNGCTSLTQAPEIIPASSIGRYSCGSMFSGCTSLTQAPALPATMIDEDCYSGMFSGCTSLTQAPVLPATTLKDYCYSSMFSGCKSLNYVKCNARNFATKSLNGWLYNVASYGTFVKQSGVSYETGSSGIPNGWTIQNI